MKAPQFKFSLELWIRSSSNFDGVASDPTSGLDPYRETIELYFRNNITLKEYRRRMEDSKGLPG